MCGSFAHVADRMGRQSAFVLLVGLQNGLGQPAAGQPSGVPDAGSASEVAVSSSGGTAPASAPLLSSARQVDRQSPNALPPSSTPSETAGNPAQAPAADPFQIRKVEGPGKSPPPPPPGIRPVQQVSRIMNTGMMPNCITQPTVALVMVPWHKPTTTIFKFRFG